MPRKILILRIDLGSGQSFTILILLAFMLIFFDNTMYSKKRASS